MSYYLGESAIPVKPVTRRHTLARGQRRPHIKRYLQKKGRKPMNRQGYPTMGTPVAVDLSMQPGHFGGEPDDAFSMKGLNPLAHASRGPVLLAAQTRGGQRILTRPLDPFSPVALGIDYPAGYAPVSVPSVTTAPASASSSGWGLIDSVVNLWNSRPQAVKDIKIRVNPVKTAQQFLSPAQMQAAVDYARRMGIDPSYQGVPITGYGANAGYRIAGMDLGQYLPWIAGGAALLFVLPMVVGRK